MAMEATYDPADVLIFVAGLRLTGFSDSSMVNIEYTSDGYTSVVGADGEVLRVRSRDRRARVTVSLMPGAIANTFLYAAMVADQASNAGVFPLAITHVAHGTSWAASQAWVVKDPGREFQKDGNQPIEWVIECADLFSVYAQVAPTFLPFGIPTPTV